MSRFLWIEDFENNVQTTVAQIFGTLLPVDVSVPENRHKLRKFLAPFGIHVELSFQDGRRFIENANQMHGIDYIVLDIDLPAWGEGDDADEKTLAYLQRWHQYTPADDDGEDEQRLIEASHQLKKVSGYHLYVALVMEYGFPRDHILICSNHGENLQSIKQAFKNAMIDEPIIYTKSTKEIQKKVQNFYDTPYSVLRRGIIESCQWVENNLHDDEQITMNQFVPDKNRSLYLDDIRLNWESIRDVLPLREPDTEIKSALFRHLLRAMSQIWEAADVWKKTKGVDRSLSAGARILKMCRNWCAHGKVFDQPLSEVVIAYIVLMNFRATFALDDSLKNHEIILLRVFDLIPFNNQTRLKSRKNLTKVLLQYIEECNHQIAHIGSALIPTTPKYFPILLNNCAMNPTCVESHGIELLRGLLVVYWMLDNPDQNETASGAFQQAFEQVFSAWCFPKKIG